MVKNYVLNLIKSYQSGYCIRISRRTNDYHYDKRYSQIYTTSAVVIKTMDSLDDSGWIDLYKGFLDRQRNRGKQTRIFPSQKFISLVENTLSTGGVSGNKKIRFIREDAKEVIQLRQKIDDNKFRLVPYKDTPKTLMMRHRLQQYNSFMRSIQALTILPLTRKELTEMTPNHAETFNNMMLNGSLVFAERRMNKGSKVKKSVPPFGREESISGGNSPTTDHSIHHQEYFCYETNTYKQYNTNNTKPITKDNNNTREKETRKNDIPITDKVAQINKQYQQHTADNSLSYDSNESIYYSIDQVLEDYPNSRKFWFRIVHTDMFRAFSDTSKGFNHHGRFYGDPVQNLPSWMRTKITMGHKVVVECDYTSIHPTMLYVMAGAVPPENIYMIDKGTDPLLRKEYKTVLLVSINHKNPDTMWNAVSAHFREEFGYKAGDERLSKKYIMGIYDRLLAHNQNIKKYMNTGVAMRLMRKDSEIVDKIMIEFISNEIPIRCIHDSFIVPAEYEADLKVLMVECVFH